MPQSHKDYALAFPKIVLACTEGKEDTIACEERHASQTFTNRQNSRLA